MISVVGRAELLSSIFYLVGLLLITETGLNVNCNNRLRLVGCIICSCIGFLCKEQCLMLLPLLIAFILVDSVQMCSKEQFTLKNVSSSKLVAKLISHHRMFDILISSFLTLSSTANRHQHKSHQLNQLNKKLRKRNKAIWLLVIAFAISLLLRLNAHGSALSVDFNDLDQIQSMVETGSLSANNTMQTDSNANYSQADRTEKFNSLSAFLTSAYVIALHFWLLFYPDRLACDWSFGSLTPVLELVDHRNLFSITLLSLYLLPFSLFVFGSNRIRFKASVRIAFRVYDYV